jgi:hypothetical protein
MIRQNMGFHESKHESPKVSGRERNMFSPGDKGGSGKKSNKKVRIADEPDVEYNWRRASQKNKGDEDFERAHEDEVAQVVVSKQKKKVNYSNADTRSRSRSKSVKRTQ